MVRSHQAAIRGIKKPATWPVFEKVQTEENAPATVYNPKIKTP